MTGVAVRRAEPDEYERVGQLTVASYRALPVDHLWGGYEDEMLDVATRAKVADVLVAVVDDTVAGAVTNACDPDSPWLEWARPGEAQFRLLAVDGAQRGRGIGEVLVRHCVERARAQDRSVIIHTTRWMDAARRLYQRLGFERRPDRDVPYEHWFQDGLELPPEWVGEPFLAYTLDPRG